MASGMIAMPGMMPQQQPMMGQGQTTPGMMAMPGMMPPMMLGGMAPMRMMSPGGLANNTTTITNNSNNIMPQQLQPQSMPNNNNILGL